MRINKIITALALTIGTITTSQAQVIFSQVSGEVQAGCTVTAPQSFPIHFQIPAGYIGRAASQIDIVCAPELTYLITGTFNRILTFPNGESAFIRIY